MELLEKAIEKAQGDTEVLIKELWSNYEESIGSIFVLISMLQCQPADLQELKRKADSVIENNYALAMRKILENHVSDY